MLNSIVPMLKETFDEYKQDETEQLGAALAYYAVFSIFPLLLLLLAIMGFVLGSEADVQQQIMSAIAANFSPQLSTSLSEALNVVKESAGTATAVGLVTLLLGASGVFQQLDRTFNKIWGIKPKPQKGGIVETITTTVREKLFSFGMVLAVGFLLLVSLALTGITNALLSVFADIPVIGGAGGFLFGLAVTLALNALIFALLFKFLPDTTVHWSDVWLAAFLTAVVWEIAKRLLALYIERSAFATAYGAVGSLLVLMAWIYFSSQVLFLGAEFSQVYARRRGSRANQQESATPAVQPASNNKQRPAQQHSSVEQTLGVIGGGLFGLKALLNGFRRSKH